MGNGISLYFLLQNNEALLFFDDARSEIRGKNYYSASWRAVTVFNRCTKFLLLATLKKYNRYDSANIIQEKKRAFWTLAYIYFTEGVEGLKLCSDLNF